MDEPGWLTEARAVLTPLKVRLPGWSTAHEFPTPRVGEHALDADQVRVVLWALRSIGDEALAVEGGMRASRKLVEDLKKHADAFSLETFVWALLEQWLAAEAPNRDAWALLAVGHLGGNACAIKLSPLISSWPEQNQHRRAAAGLEVLDLIGTDTALTQLNHLARRAGSPALQKKARGYIQAIAERRGMGTEDLEDRIIPDCGLDTHGRRVFDYGSRQFDLLLGPDLKPKVQLPTGKRQSTLPPPNAKDDPDKAAAAKSAWTVLKKQLAEILKVQGTRMKNAMIHGRRWKLDDFERFYVYHPVMVHLSRAVLWGGFGANGATPFRVSDECEFLDVEDQPLAPQGFESIGILHPASLDRGVLLRWSQLFSDYQLISPFPQLGRPVYRAEGDERSLTELSRYAGRSVPGSSLVYPLQNIGWVLSGKCFVKTYPAARVRAVFAVIGDVASAFYDTARPISMGVCHFEREAQEGGAGERLPIGTVDDIAYSETVHDLDVVASKAI